MTLERWDLVVDLRSVVEVIVVFAGRGEGELDAVTAHPVIACEQGHATERADRAASVVLLWTRTTIFMMFPGTPHFTAWCEW